MPTYSIAWGHAGTQGKEWHDAREASRYSASLWGEVEAESPEAAVQVAQKEGVLVADWYEADGTIHVIPPTE